MQKRANVYVDEWHACNNLREAYNYCFIRSNKGFVPNNSIRNDKMNLTGDSIMKFGKHKGKKLSDIPTGYFLYLYDRKLINDELKKYLENNVPVLKN